MEPPAPSTSDGNPAAIDVENHEFIIPVKEIKVPADIQKWEKSEAYRDYLGFLQAMNTSIKNVKIRDDYPVSKIVTDLVQLLDKLDHWIDETPPVDQPQRFGNRAFRDWYNKVESNVNDLLKEATGVQFHKAIPEIRIYFVESFGNSTRIDYGTGHEMMFAAFLCCLYKLGAFTEEDAVAVVLKLFFRYIVLVQKLQQTYRMEPAGSQGVWSLDDYQFIPFIWGSSQLLDHKRILPKSFPDEDICVSFSKDYMFLACIQYIHKVKTGPFAEHSNQLWNISGVKLWSKVNSGLLKMYKAEVLAKFPVIQHFPFGSLMRIHPAS